MITVSYHHLRDVCSSMMHLDRGGLRSKSFKIDKAKHRNLQPDEEIGGTYIYIYEYPANREDVPK